jgi:hypothetical protein
MNGIQDLCPDLPHQLDNFCYNSKDIVAFNSEGDITLIDLSENYQNNQVHSLVILVNDAREIDSKLEDTSFVLNQLINNDSDIYVIYHASENFDYKYRHKFGLTNNFADKIKGELESHHIKESPHNKLYKCLFPFQNDRLANLVSIFPNPILEAKLNLLHKCLTPEGAKVVKGELDKHLGYFKDIKDDVKKINHNGKTVVEHLSEQTNCFDEDNYIKPLSKLRDALLPE